MIGQNRIIVVAALAREGFGARIEIGTLLNDDARARPAVLVAADQNRAVAVIDHRLFLCLGCLRAGRQRQQGANSAQNDRRGDNFKFHGVLDLCLYCNAV